MLAQPDSTPSIESLTTVKDVSPTQFHPSIESLTTVNLRIGRVPQFHFDFRFQISISISNFISISMSMQHWFSMCEMKSKFVPLTNLVANRNPRIAKKRPRLACLKPTTCGRGQKNVKKTRVTKSQAAR